MGKLRKTRAEHGYGCIACVAVGVNDSVVLIHFKRKYFKTLHIHVDKSEQNCHLQLKMYKVDVPVDVKKAARIHRLQRAEEKRKLRIFNSKQQFNGVKIHSNLLNSF